MIVPGSKYGNVRKQASSDTPHGLTPNTIEALGDRMEKFLPGLSSTEGKASNQFFDGLLPDGAELDPRTQRTANITKVANCPSGTTFPGFSNNQNVSLTPQRPYQPEFESPDRQQYPVHRILANRYWRLFYKLDPVIGNCVDMFATMPWSNFQLTGEGVSGEIKESFETMCQETQVLRILEYMVREFLVIGEAVPHCFFDDAKGIWSYIALHNPDQLEVIDAPFIKMDPVVEFIPDDRLRSVLTSNNRLLRRVREQMPPELISRLVARQNIPLSPINMTFIPRRLHPYDTRGTSIISRMWRILMYEDGIYNASIATARRHAGPIKVAKLGNPQTGWIPSQEHERRLLQLLAQAELDVNAWLVYHYGINFEMVGTTDRIMNIAQHHDVIERIKLIAMGISKSFLHGEVTYASSVTGLSVFLQRLRAMRDFFVNTWLLPKFFKPIAQINGWVKRDKGEINHRYRIKRSQRQIEAENRWIIPKLEWEKQLDHTINSELVTAMQALEQMGIKFSKTSKYAAVGKKFEDEINKIAEEQELENTIKHYVKDEQPPEGAAPGGKPALPAGGMGVKPTPPRSPPAGMPGGGGMPGTTPGSSGPTPGGPGGMGTPPPSPGGPMGESDKGADGGGTGPSGKKDPAMEDATSDVYDHKGRVGNWSASEIEELKELLLDGDTKSPFWEQIKGHNLNSAIAAGDKAEIMEIISEHAMSYGYVLSDIKQLEQVLEKEGVFNQIAVGDTNLMKLEDKLPEDSGMLNDSAMMNRLSSYIDGGRPDVVTLSRPDMLLVGHGNESHESAWNGDISSILDE